MENTLISWANHTVNFWWGCTKVSPACFACYAEAMARMWRAKDCQWGPNGARWMRAEKAGAELHKLARNAKAAGVRHRVFINSMSDTFEDHQALANARESLFTRVEECGYALDILLLTKRPENIVRMVPKGWLNAWPRWVWVGTTVEDQTRANERIPELLKVPAAVRFLSCEPLLGPVDLAFGDPKWRTAESYHAYIHWVICGGESGPKPRPMAPEWARSLRDQCAAAGVAFHFKQWGGRSPKEAGHELDGVTHQAFPTAA